MEGDFVEDFELQIGRQDFEDGREWLFDERLDGVRLVYDENDWEITLAVAREGLVRKDLLRSNRTKAMDNFLISAEREITEDLDVVGYFFRQQDQVEGETRNFLGVQAEGEVGSGLDVWLDAAVLRETTAAARACAAMPSMRGSSTRFQRRESRH